MELNLPCPKCDDGLLEMVRDKYGLRRAVCSNRPACKHIYGMRTAESHMSTENCKGCGHKGYVSTVHDMKTFHYCAKCGEKWSTWNS